LIALDQLAQDLLQGHVQELEALQLASPLERPGVVGHPVPPAPASASAPCPRRF
jgi:hypothetical protein